MQTRNLDAYRTHADLTSALTLSLPPALSSAPREETVKAMNRLRLTMYINHVDASKPTLDIVDDANTIKAWIETHTIETQVFLNALGAGITEDGVRGDQTVDCIKKLLGITTVSVLLTPPTPPITGAVIPPVITTSLPGVDSETPEDEEVNGNDAFTPEQMVNMRRTILSDPHLKGELEKIGVRFVRNEDTGNLDMILPDAFESTPEYRQLQTYIRALHMTTDPEYTNPLTLTDEMRREKMEMFFEIIRGSGDHIRGREFLAYKLINSINEDLKRDPRGPYIMTRSGEQGEYGIFEFPITRNASDYTISSSLAPATLPYHDLLKAGNISDDYISFATTYALIESNHVAFQGREFLGQATLVNRILSNHGINGVSEEDVQDGNLLIADWDIVVDQIDEKIAALSTGSAQNVDAYQELMYVKDLIEGKEWMAEGRTTDMFREINTFGRLFLEEKSLIDDTIARLNGSGTDETTGEMIRNIAAENLFGLPGLIALFIAIFNIGGLGKTAGYGLLGAAGAMAAGSIYDSVTDRTGDPLSGANGGENLELVRIRQLQYGIKGGDAVNATLAKMYTENDRRLESSTTTATKLEFAQEPLVLGKILFEVSESNELSTLDLADNTLATQIFDQMKADDTLAVDGTEFTSNISRNPTVTQEDVNAFVEILRTQTDTGLDTTLGDILVAGDIDKLNHNYDSSWYTFTENSDIDNELHQEFIKLWGTNNTPGARDKREDIQEVLEKFDELLFSGAGDAASTAGANAGSITAGVTGAVSAATGVSVNDRELKIIELEAYINSNTTLAASPIIRQKLLDTLDNYKVLLKKQVAFAALKDSWYEGPVGARIQLQDLTKWLRGQNENEANLAALRRDISTNTTALTALMTGLPTSTLFDALKAEIQAELTYLEDMDKRAMLKIVALADFAAVSSGTGLDISQDVNLAKVTAVAQGKQDQLRDSIKTGATDYFGALNANIRQTIEIAYRDAANTTRQGGDISMQTGINLWNSIHEGIAGSLGSIPRFGPAIKLAVTSQLPSPIDPTTSLPRVLDTRTVDDIEAQVKLGLIKAYITETQGTIHNYEALESMYVSKLPTATPVGSTDTPEQAKLRDILTTQHDASITAIRAEITRFASSYTGVAQQTAITRLTTSTLNNAELLKYESINDFVLNSTNLDKQIGDIKTLVTATFVDNPNFLDTILISVAQIETDLNTKEGLLRTYVEGTPSPLDVVAGDNIAQINEKIDFANRLKVILGAPTTVLDAKITALEAEKIRIATLAEVPGLLQAIKDDLKLLTGSEDGIPTTTTYPFGQAGSIIGDLETGTPPATYSGSPALASTPEYAVALELRKLMMGADSRAYGTFKSSIKTDDARYRDASGTVRTQDIWTMISGSGLAGNTLNIINTINSN